MNENSEASAGDPDSAGGRNTGWRTGGGPDVSIVIPARNEAQRLGPTLDALAGARFEGSVEVIVVDDGSIDATAALVREFRLGTLPPPRYVRNIGVGKGAALRTGIDSARGHVVVLMDADLPVSIEDLVEFVAAAAQSVGTQIVVGTRRQRGSTNGQPALRRAGGSGFLLLTRVMGYGVVSDPQCGLKALAGSEAVAAALDSRSSGFEWDIELLARAQRRGVPVRELPVDWIHRPGSTVRPVRDALRTLWGLARLRPSLRSARPPDTTPNAPTDAPPDGR